MNEPNPRRRRWTAERTAGAALIVVAVGLFVANIPTFLPWRQNGAPGIFIVAGLAAIIAAVGLRWFIGSPRS